MPAIDIGPGATDRASNFSEGNTVIDLANPANDSGLITTAQFWFNTNATGVRVGTFYLVGGSTYHCRAAVAIGAVVAGDVRTFPGLSIAVVAGDLFGFYSLTGIIEAIAGGGGGAGVRYVFGANKCNTGDEASYTLSAGQAVSIYGIGATVGWGHKICGITPAKVMGIAVADIVKICGV